MSAKRFCKFCDENMARESFAADSEWVCTNPNCGHSPMFVPFLKLPDEQGFRFVNDGEDISLHLTLTDHTYDDLVFLRMAYGEGPKGNKHYGWFIEQCGYDWEDQLPQDGARYFIELVDCVNDAINYIRQSKRWKWQRKIEAIERFMELQSTQ